VLRRLEADPSEGLTAIEALVDPVAPADTALAVGLAGTHPHDLRILGIDGHATDRVGAVAVEDRLPGGTRVDGLPHPSRGHRHIPDAVVGWVLGHVGDPPGHEGRSDPAQLEAREGGAREAVGLSPFRVGSTAADRPADTGRRNGHQTD